MAAMATVLMLSVLSVPCSEGARVQGNTRNWTSTVQHCQSRGQELVNWTAIDQSVNQTIIASTPYKTRTWIGGLLSFSPYVVWDSCRQSQVSQQTDNMPVKHIRMAGNGIFTCSQFCKNTVPQSVAIGLEGDICTCLEDINTVVEDDRKCNRSCSNNFSGETCGGSKVMTVYSFVEDLHVSSYWQYWYPLTLPFVECVLLLHEHLDSDSEAGDSTFYRTSCTDVQNGFLCESRTDQQQDGSFNSQHGQPSFVTEPHSWESARQRCAGMNGRLAGDLTTAQEAAADHDILGQYWTGVFRTAQVSYAWEPTVEQYCLAFEHFNVPTLTAGNCSAFNQILCFNPAEEDEDVEDGKDEVGEDRGESGDSDEEHGTSGGSAGVTVAAVLVPLLVVAVIAVAAVVYRRRHLRNRQVPAIPTADAASPEVIYSTVNKDRWKNGTVPSVPDVGSGRVGSNAEESEDRYALPCEGRSSEVDGGEYNVLHAYSHSHSQDEGRSDGNVYDHTTSPQHGNNSDNAYDHTAAWQGNHGNNEYDHIKVSPHGDYNNQHYDHTATIQQ